MKCDGGGLDDVDVSVCQCVARSRAVQLLVEKEATGLSLSRPLGLRIDPGKRENVRGLVKRGLQGRCLVAGGGFQDVRQRRGVDHGSRVMYSSWGGGGRPSRRDRRSSRALCRAEAGRDPGELGVSIQSPKWRGRGGMDRMVEGSVGPVRLGSPLEMKAGDVVFSRESAVACRPNGASIDDRGPSREPAKNQAGSFNERQGPQTSS